MPKIELTLQLPIKYLYNLIKGLKCTPLGLKRAGVVMRNTK